MALYKGVKEGSDLWRVELDMRGMNPGIDFAFTGGQEMITLGMAEKMMSTPSTDGDKLSQRVVEDWGRRSEAARAEGRNLFSGPLAHMRGIRQVPFQHQGVVAEFDCGPIVHQIQLGKTDYAAHHATVPLGGKHNDWTRANNPTWGVEVVDGKFARAVFDKPSELATAFAAAILPVTNDGKLVYGIRNSAVDCYRNTWSLPSGGRFSGNPHDAVDELIADPSSVYAHVAKTLGLEFPDLDSVEGRVGEVRPLGIFRANDYDVTIAFAADVDASAEELQAGINGRKYVQSGSVSASEEGMRDLLGSLGRFPATIQGVLGLVSESYGVDPLTVMGSNGTSIQRYDQ